MLNNGALMSDAVAANDLFGSATTIDNALDIGTVNGAAEYFFNFGWATWKASSGFSRRPNGSIGHDRLEDQKCSPEFGLKIQFLTSGKFCVL